MLAHTFQICFRLKPAGPRPECGTFVAAQLRPKGTPGHGQAHPTLFFEPEALRLLASPATTLFHSSLGLGRLRVCGFKFVLGRRRRRRGRGLRCVESGHWWGASGGVASVLAVAPAADAAGATTAFSSGFGNLNQVEWVTVGY
jgi:hypothetical protein